MTACMTAVTAYLPGPVDDVQHARLGGLGVGVEPGGRGQVEPGGGHEVGVLQEPGHCAEHGVREGPVVKVVGQLLSSASIVLLP